MSPREKSSISGMTTPQGSAPSHEMATSWRLVVGTRWSSTTISGSPVGLTKPWPSSPATKWRSVVWSGRSTITTWLQVGTTTRSTFEAWRASRRWRAFQSIRLLWRHWPGHPIRKISSLLGVGRVTKALNSGMLDPWIYWIRSILGAKYVL